jgi:hypothetical protein
MTSPRSSSSVILRMTLVWSAVITGILAVVGAVIGYLVAGPTGLASALVGVLLAGLFLGMTALIILIAGRLPAGPMQIPTFFGIVLGGWVVKLVVFIVALLVLRGQPWIEPFIFFFSVLVSVIASLVVDLVVMARARVPYVGDVDLPTSSEASEERTDGS